MNKTKWSKILTILSLIFFLLGLLFTIIFLNLNKRKYEIINKTNYEVILNPNPFFNEDISKYNYYISKSIKDIKVNFNYTLKSKTNISYSYDIKAIINSYTDDGTKLIWQKANDLKAITNQTGKEINIKKSFTFNYNFYVNYIKTLEEYYHLNTISYLTIILNIKIKDANYIIEVDIPLNEDITEITTTNKENILNKEIRYINIYKMLAIITILISIILFSIEINLKKHHKNNFLNAYQDIIIVLKNKPIFNNFNIININTFNDLITIANNYNTNIFNYQNNYYVIISNTCYIYAIDQK